jgi:uncharacterized membrane protein YdbT with pleckstrin-like domain
MAVESISTEELHDFLRKRAIFRDLHDEAIEEIAARLGEFRLEEGNNLFLEGDDSYVFYIVHTGLVRIWHKEDTREITYGLAESGDKFGEEGLLYNKRRTANVTALKPTHLLTLDLGDFSWMTNTYPQTRRRLQEIASSYERLRSQDFDWLFNGEFVHLITQRHFVELIDNIWQPFLVFMASLFFGFLGWVAPFVGMTTLLYGLGGVFMGIAILWIIWGFVDWRNDYFFITNQRVIWLEEVPFVSNSRQETPLSAIQGINVNTSYWGRVLGYGNVEIRTFTGTGSLRLTKLQDPVHFKSQIEELILRVRRQNQDTRQELMRNEIRTSLGLEDKVEETAEIIKSPQPEKDPEKGFGFFTTREMSEEGVIIYHKHPWILFRSIALPTLITLVVSILIPTLFWRDFATDGDQFPSVLMVLGAGLPTLAVLLFWVWYIYEDWSNDLYRVSKDSITDSEKTPFSRELTRTAPLRNVQSINYSREGILNTILNMGDVNIVIADETLTFETVFNPAHIQQDIIYRLENLKQSEEDKRQQEESENMLRWLRIYHEVNEEKTAAEEAKNGEEGDQKS